MRAIAVLTVLAATLATLVAAYGARAATDVATPAASRPSVASSSPAPSSSPATSRVPVLYQVRDGAQVDLGWTGISHDQPWPAGQRLGFELVCTTGDPACTVGGGEPDAPFGAPVALSSGGVPVCVVNTLRAPLTGTVNSETGCGEIRFGLTTAVFMGPEVARPCPVCSGDKTPHDGRKEGKCSGGATADAPCDAQSSSGRFGATSNDCLPQGTSVGRLPVDLQPLTTGGVRVEAQEQCKRRRPGLKDTCFCAGQPQPNDCDSGVCGTDELCEEGPIDGACSKETFRTCNPNSGDADCEATFKGAGTCKIRTRPCFGDAISATGTCDPKRPTYVAVLCTGATGASAVNSSAGLAGPARLVLPLERID